MQTPDGNFSDLCCDMTPTKGVNRIGGGDKAHGPQVGESQVHLVPQVRGPRLLAGSTVTHEFPLVNVDWGRGGDQNLCPLHHLTPRVGPQCM